MEARTPAPRALAAVKAGPPTEPIDKQLRITAKVRRAIDLMARGECRTILEAAAKPRAFIPPLKSFNLPDLAFNVQVDPGRARAEGESAEVDGKEA
jgi:hypothetical protein